MGVSIARRLGPTLIAVAVVVAGAPAVAHDRPSTPPTHWVGSWAAAMTPGASGRAEDGFTDTTLRQVAHLSVGGDQVRIRISGAFSRLDTSRYFLAGVDVTASASGSVVFFGDSITDGVASPSDANTRYPDQVADRLLQRPDVRELGVLNVGLSGNRVLTDAGAAGDSALRRFDRDVLSQTGVGTVVLLEGINDIGATLGEVDAREIISAYRQLIARAHNAGIDVVGGTITPFQGAVYYSEAGEADRQAVNRWIRGSGEFDAVVDFDAALRDPSHPLRLRPAYDSGDHLHPSEAGLAAMAAAVDLHDLEGS